MSEAVKTPTDPRSDPRPYDNSRRAARVRATKSRVVQVARALFVERGYAATSIEAISVAADTPPATLYRLFATKRGILSAVLNVSFVGDDEPIALHDRASVQALRAEPDPRPFLEGFAHVAREVSDRSAPLQHVLRSAASVDPEIADLLATINAQRYEGQANVARGLATRRALPDGITERDANDIIYALMSPEVRRILTVERGWGADRYEQWLARTLCATLLRPEREGEPAAGS